MSLGCTPAKPKPVFNAKSMFVKLRNKDGSQTMLEIGTDGVRPKHLKMQDIVNKDIKIEKSITNLDLDLNQDRQANRDQKH